MHHNLVDLFRQKYFFPQANYCYLQHRDFSTAKKPKTFLYSVDPFVQIFFLHFLPSCSFYIPTGDIVNNWCMHFVVRISNYDVVGKFGELSKSWTESCSWRTLVNASIVFFLHASWLDIHIYTR